MLLLRQAVVRNTFRSDPLRYKEQGWRGARFLGRGRAICQLVRIHSRKLTTGTVDRTQAQLDARDHAAIHRIDVLLWIVGTFHPLTRSATMIYVGWLHLRRANLFLRSTVQIGRKRWCIDLRRGCTGWRKSCRIKGFECCSLTMSLFLLAGGLK